MLENRTPGVTIVRRIQSLKATRQYLADQLALARKALGAELQAESVLSSAARGQTAGRAGFDELLYMLQANKDPGSVVRLMQRQKEVMKSMAVKIELVQSRLSRLDPDWDGTGDAGSLMKQALSTPKSLRRLVHPILRK